MVPILENLYFDSRAFLAPIKKVRLEDDRCEESGNYTKVMDINYEYYRNEVRKLIKIKI